MPAGLGNSGAPRWYDLDLDRLPQYIDLITSAGANATEIVLVHGYADEFTRRVHVVQADWEPVIRAYRDVGLRTYLHAPLTPEFALAHFREEPRRLRALFRPVLELAAQVAADQGETVLVLHGAADPGLDQAGNEHLTARALDSAGT